MVCSCYSSIMIAGRGSRIPPRSRFFLLWGAHFQTFSLIFRLKIWNEKKNAKNAENHWFLAPKTLQKSHQNTLFSLLFLEWVFNAFLEWFLVAPNLKNSDFTKEKQRFSWKLPFRRKLKKTSKKHRKTSPKPCPNHKKIKVKNMSIFKLDFFEFLCRFGRAQATKMGDKIVFLTPKIVAWVIHATR